MRNAPVIECAICDHTIPRDVTVVWVYRELYEQLEFMGVPIQHLVERYAVTVCEPCWDAAWPVPGEYYRRSAGEHIFDIAGGRCGSRPYPQCLPCDHCGRRVMASSARRRVWSCSKRCQVYASQARWPRPTMPRSQRSERKCHRRGCGRSYTPRTADHWYCSNACRQADYRRRNKTARNANCHRAPATIKKAEGS